METQQLANELGDVREQIAKLEAKKSELQDALILSMKNNGLKGVRTDYGESISRVWKTTYKILDKADAFEWAEKNSALRTDIDTKRMNAILARTKKLPSAFEKIESEYLRMTKSEAEVTNEE